jgi:hypothetical protein
MIALFTLTACSNQTSNRAPIVVEMAATPAKPLRGEVVTVSAQVRDPDGDPVACAWSASRGTLHACIGTAAQWQAPWDTSTSVISLKVSDPSEASDSTRLLLTVAETTYPATLYFRNGDTLRCNLVGFREFRGMDKFQFWWEASYEGLFYWSDEAFVNMDRIAFGDTARDKNGNHYVADTMVLVNGDSHVTYTLTFYSFDYLDSLLPDPFVQVEIGRLSAVDFRLGGERTGEN